MTTPQTIRILIVDDHDNVGQGLALMLQVFDGLLRNAIHRTHLHEQTEKRPQHIQALRTIDMAITSSFDLRLTLNIVLWAGREGVLLRRRADDCDARSDQHGQHAVLPALRPSRLNQLGDEHHRHGGLAEELLPLRRHSLTNEHPAHRHWLHRAEKGDWPRKLDGLPREILQLLQGHYRIADQNDIGQRFGQA